MNEEQNGWNEIKNDFQDIAIPCLPFSELVSSWSESDCIKSYRFANGSIRFEFVDNFPHFFYTQYISADDGTNWMTQIVTIIEDECNWSVNLGISKRRNIYSL